MYIRDYLQCYNKQINKHEQFIMFLFTCIVHTWNDLDIWTSYFKKVAKAYSVFTIHTLEIFNSM